jgi:hypothetical protein
LLGGLFGNLTAMFVGTGAKNDVIALGHGPTSQHVRI